MNNAKKHIYLITNKLQQMKPYYWKIGQGGSTYRAYLLVPSLVSSDKTILVQLA